MIMHTISRMGGIFTHSQRPKEKFQAQTIAHQVELCVCEYHLIHSNARLTCQLSALLKPLLSFGHHQGERTHVITPTAKAISAAPIANRHVARSGPVYL